MILSCSHISKSFPGKEILCDGSFHIEEHEKAALIGINGAGKSTLLQIITGKLSPDSGEVTVSKDCRIGYLEQHQDLPGGHTILEELMGIRSDLIRLEQDLRDLEQQMPSLSGKDLEDALTRYDRMNHTFEQENGYALKSEVTGILKGLGFSENDFSKSVHTLSGGQKTRVALGKLLLTKPDLLLLDEPTNHLDLNSVAWLETYLLNYPGSVLVVSHDRYFLDKIVTKVIEIEAGKFYVLEGNYSAFREKKQQLRDIQLKAWLNQQKDIRHQEEVIEKLRSFNREKSIRRAESREKMLAKTERLEKPPVLDSSMRLHLEPSVLSGNDVLSVRGYRKQYGNQLLFSDASFEIRRGEKVAVIGDNGTGKSTLLKMILGMVEADCGEAVTGSKVMTGYYDQEHQNLDMEKTLFEEISDAHPNMNNTDIRNVLASFLFTGEDVLKPIHTLSGGERGRISLALLMLSSANFLLLDEPTNHLDMVSREILERTIQDYTGTVLYVSHDRYFINQTATRILELKAGKFINYIGNYDYYLEKKDLLQPKETFERGNEGPAAGKQDWQTQKEASARLRKLENDFRKTEDRIALLEEEKGKIMEEMGNPEVYSNSGKLVELGRRLKETEEELALLYPRWEELAERLS